MTTATDLWAVRYPATHELSIFEGRPHAGGGDHSLIALTDRIRAHSLVLVDQRVLIVATERVNSDPGWRLMKPGELLHIGASHSMESSYHHHSKPMDLIPYGQLGPAAAASQHPLPRVLNNTPGWILPLLHCNSSAAPPSGVVGMAARTSHRCAREGHMPGLRLLATRSLPDSGKKTCPCRTPHDCWPHPVMTGGYLALRTYLRLYCRAPTGFSSTSGFLSVNGPWGRGHRLEAQAKAAAASYKESWSAGHPWLASTWPLTSRTQPVVPRLGRILQTPHMQWRRTGPTTAGRMWI